jgi:hypothetical protein
VLHDGRRLSVVVELDRGLTPRRYTFDLLTRQQRLWGWHGHQEPVGSHHEHWPPHYLATPREAATFEAIAARLHDGRG